MESLNHWFSCDIFDKEAGSIVCLLDAGQKGPAHEEEGDAKELQTYENCDSEKMVGFQGGTGLGFEYGLHNITAEVVVLHQSYRQKKIRLQN